MNVGTTIKNPVCECCRTKYNGTVSTMDATQRFFRRDVQAYHIWVCSDKCKKHIEQKFNVKFYG